MRATALLAAVIGLAACDGAAAKPSSTPLLILAHNYVLGGAVLAGYQKAQDMALSPDSLVTQNNDPHAAELANNDGLASAAVTTYAPPSDNPAALPFSALSSEALVFGGAQGAAAYFGHEAARVNQPPSDGTITQLDGVPLAGTDQVAAFDSAAPSPTDSSTMEHAYLVLARRGQVIVELFAQAASASTTPQNFAQFVSPQLTLLQQSPVAGAAPG